jgi:hypothetical protein
MKRLNPDPLTVPEPDPVPRRSGCVVAALLGLVLWAIVAGIFALGFFVRDLVG